MRGTETTREAANAASATHHRRWWIAVLLLAGVLVAYAGALTWVTQRLQVDIQKSIHPAVSISDHRGGE